MAASRERRQLQLTLSDKKEVAKARLFANEYRKELTDIKVYFLQKGWFGLWWDHIGISGSSDPNEVCENLEEYLKLAENLIEVTKSVEDGKSDSYEKLQEFYEELKEKEEEAERGLKESKSKTVVKMYRDFLQTKTIEMDRKLSKVECAAQRLLIKDMKRDVKEINDKLEARAGRAEEEARRQREVFREEARRQMENLQKEARSQREALRRENQQLRETLMRTNEEAKKRCEALHRENQKLRELMEESSRKADERMLRLLEILKERQN